MSETPETGVDAPAAADALENLATATQTAAPESAPEGADASGEIAEGHREAPEEPKRPKSPVAQLQGRVGHLTKTLHEKDNALSAAQKELETYRALLAAQGKSPEGEGVPASESPRSATLTPGSADWQAAVRREAEQLARQEAFTRDCNAIFVAGTEKHGDGFKEAVTNLNALGLMNEALVQAAIATGAAPEVINHLGADVDEAARITALPPVQMAVELTKLAGKLSGPKEAKQVSRAPAPITPVGGATQASTDVYDPNLSMDEYVRRRKAMGSRWAK